jgi:HlyD family secretion protein
MNKNYIGTILFFFLSLILSSCSLFSQNTANMPLTVSGTIEANTVNLAPEIGGKIIAIDVQEGDTLDAGMRVFQLDDAMLQAQLNQASAALKAAQASQAVAQANLELLQAGPTDAQIQAAQGIRVSHDLEFPPRGYLCSKSAPGFCPDGLLQHDRRAECGPDR